MTRPAKVSIDLHGARGCTAFNLRRTARVVSQLYDRSLAAAAVRSTQFAILVTIARTQPAAIGRLTELVLMDQTTMTRNLKVMHRRGWVEISARGARREKLVRLTAKGVGALKQSEPLWRDIQTRFVESFGERRWSSLRRDLGLLANLAEDFRARR